MDAQPQQQQTSIEGTQVRHIRFYRDELQELVRLCEENGEMTVAVRIFPSDEYKWQYPTTLVTFARARLEASGRATELNTVMDNKQSRIVLVSAEARCAVGEVQASVTKSPHYTTAADLNKSGTKTDKDAACSACTSLPTSPMLNRNTDLDSTSCTETNQVNRDN